MRGRSRGRRNPPLNSPHRPDHIAPSQPISPDARYTRGRSRPERPVRQPSVSRETRNPIIYPEIPRSPILQEQFHGYAMPQPMPVPMYGFPGQAYGGAATHSHAYPTPGVPPVIPATQYRGPDPFGSRPPRRGRPASDPPSPTGSHSFHPNGPYPAPTYGQSGDAYANPYPYGIPTQPYYSAPPVVPQIPLAPVPEPRYETVDPFSFNRRRRENPIYYYAPDGDIPPVSSPASHPSAPSTGSSSHHSHPNSPSHSDAGLPLPGPLLLNRRRPTWHKRFQRLLQCLLIFILDILITIPQQIYLHLLLRLPLLYFSRVSRLFEDANLSLPDIRRMAVANADQWHDGSPGALLTTWLPPDAIVPPHLLNFRHSWEGFIDSLLRQWETQNYVSALLLAAIITMLQIDAAASDPIARTTAILSLISALMSILFGSMYIIRFGTMRKMYKAAIWADEAQNTRTSVLWNEWIMLAIPAVWLAWSLILFVTCIMAYAWRTGAAEDPVNAVLSNNAALGLRIGASAVLGVALVYFFSRGKNLQKIW
ncbi:hypothetical protein B0H14DRAFT_1184778 [Mycena olivaceomarginata]|nr:hypothetical protein B0H14DRAFT_1184778 [Mycena olivaceomarginata]